MKLTNVLQHGKQFWWGKGWGPKPRANTDHYYWRQQWGAQRRRKLEIVSQVLPEGVVPEDPNIFVKNSYLDSFPKTLPDKFDLPWPYSKRPVKGLYLRDLYLR